MADASPDGRERQLALNLGDTWSPRKPASRRPDEVFFALAPDALTAGQIAELGQALRSRYELSSPLRPPRVFHISLTYVSPFDDRHASVVAAAQRTAATIESSAFDVTLDRVMSFRGGRSLPFVLRCGSGERAIASLREALEAGMRDAGLKRPGRSGFTPHLTLLFDPKVVPETMLPKPINWRVREFVLVRSLYGQARHEHLGRWPLRA